MAITHLGTATTRIIYDLDTVPASAATIARETHASDLTQGQQTNVQLSFSYSDGFGPNHTFEKVVFDPWQQTTFDVNDTCAPRPTRAGEPPPRETGDPRTEPDIRGYVARYFASLPASPPAPAWQTWHAQRSSFGRPAAKWLTRPDPKGSWRLHLSYGVVPRYPGDTAR